MVTEDAPFRAVGDCICIFVDSPAVSKFQALKSLAVKSQVTL